MRYLLALVLVGFMAGCAKAPPTLSPAGAADFHKTQVVDQLNILRDTVIRANALPNPLISTDDTRVVVKAHRSILVTIQASQAGWQTAVGTALDELGHNLKPQGAAFIAPYVALAKTLLQEIP
jgi:hypothetical protein